MLHGAEFIFVLVIVHLLWFFIVPFNKLIFCLMFCFYNCFLKIKEKIETKHFFFGHHMMPSMIICRYFHCYVLFHNKNVLSTLKINASMSVSANSEMKSNEFSSLWWDRVINIVIIFRQIVRMLIIVHHCNVVISPGAESVMNNIMISTIISFCTFLL